ncbi:hypothetical protein LIZ62_09825 [Fusicatenibacter saccharivorans]|nr:hypothetical protein [Fusicatenibacter saccharivorans]PWY58660.1 hypothetical protein DMI82_14500 [Blautia sp. BCRC 81119]RGZ06996.1 hypothetical protein DXA08_11325 [Blautia obeum]RHO88971.1 hypothetical protein DW049_04765 [Ruminococcus sp. AF41-9]RHP71904.1 hypothetical protein DXA48_14220 [Ruminococcus sp. OF02-6]
MRGRGAGIKRRLAGIYEIQKSRRQGRWRKQT